MPSVRTALASATCAAALLGTAGSDAARAAADRLPMDCGRVTIRDSIGGDPFTYRAQVEITIEPMTRGVECAVARKMVRDYAERRRAPKGWKCRPGVGDKIGTPVAICRPASNTTLTVTGYGE